MIQPDPIGGWALSADDAAGAVYVIWELIENETLLRWGEREQAERVGRGERPFGWNDLTPRFREALLEANARGETCGPDRYPLWRLGASVLQRDVSSGVMPESVVRSAVGGEAARVYREVFGAHRLCVRCSEVSDLTRPSDPARSALADYVDDATSFRLRKCAEYIDAALSQQATEDDEVDGALKCATPTQRVILWALDLEGAALTAEEIEAACQTHRLRSVSVRTISTHRAKMRDAGWIRDSGRSMEITQDGRAAKGTSQPSDPPSRVRR